MKRLSLIAALALLGACASNPTPVSAPAVPPTAPSASTAPAADGHFAAAGAQVGVWDPAMASWARTQGYKPTLRDGKPLWCRNEKAIGSNLAHTECVSEATIAEMQRAYAANKQDLQNSLQGCQGGTCGQK